MPRKSEQVQETLISYSPSGIFSLRKGRLATSWNMQAMSGRPILRSDLIRIFSSKLDPDNGSKRSVVAKVRIIGNDTDGITDLRLLEHAYLET